MCFSISYHNNNPLALANRYTKILTEQATKSLEQMSLPKYYFVSGFEFPQLPVITSKGVFLFTWGLIPNWTKDLKQAKDIRSHTLNAAGETIFDKPSFRQSILLRRCILPVNGFFEWQHVGDKKLPYYIFPNDDLFFSLGCVCDLWNNIITGQTVYTFSIVTTHANETMSMIHNTKKRMPLILDKQTEAQWLDKSLNREQIESLIKPCKESLIGYHRVSPIVNSSHNQRNVPEAIENIEAKL